MKRFIELVRRPISEERGCETRLLQLPVELLLIIAEPLPTQDAAVLDLTSKRYFQTLLPPGLRSLATCPREELLRRLERDLGASHFYCSYCSKLH